MFFEYGTHVFDSNLNYYLILDVCASFRVSVCLSFCQKKLPNGCTYQKMLLYKVVTFLKKIKMAVLFWIFVDQICPKWIKLDFLQIKKCYYKKLPHLQKG